MQKITGIGGVFFRSQDPDGLAAWYEKNFGINSMASGDVWQQEAGATVFCPFPADTDYFGRPDQQAMFNFRVEDLDAMRCSLSSRRMESESTKTEWTNRTAVSRGSTTPRTTKSNSGNPSIRARAPP